MDNPHLYKEDQGLNFLTDEPMWSWRCDGKIQAARFVATHNPSMYAILHPSTKSRGKWQVSYFRDVLHSSLGMLTSSHVKLKDWGNLCYFTGHVGRWNTVSS